MEAALPIIIQLISSLIAEAPNVAQVIASAKDFFQGLFDAGLITKETQDRVFAHLDILESSRLAGVVPPAWTVEADPS